MFIKAIKIITILLQFAIQFCIVFTVIKTDVRLKDILDEPWVVDCII